MSENYIHVLRKITEAFREGENDGKGIFQLSTPTYSFEVLIEEKSTSLKVWITSTGEPIMALGWPFINDLVDDSHIIDVIAELGSFIQFVRREQQPRTFH